MESGVSDINGGGGSAITLGGSPIMAGGSPITVGGFSIRTQIYKQTIMKKRRRQNSCSTAVPKSASDLPAAALFFLSRPPHFLSGSRERNWTTDKTKTNQRSFKINGGEMGGRERGMSPERRHDDLTDQTTRATTTR